MMVVGARPLKRVIQKNPQDTAAELVLDGAVKTGAAIGGTRGGARAHRLQIAAESPNG